MDLLLLLLFTIVNYFFYKKYNKYNYISRDIQFFKCIFKIIYYFIRKFEKLYLQN